MQEAKRHRTSLEKLKKEDEIRTKKKIKEKVYFWIVIFPQNPRMDALKAMIEKKAQIQKENNEMENMKSTIQTFLSPDASSKGKTTKKVFL